MTLCHTPGKDYNRAHIVFDKLNVRLSTGGLCEFSSNFINRLLCTDFAYSGEHDFSVSNQPL